MKMKILYTSEIAKEIYDAREKKMEWSLEDSGMDLSYVGDETIILHDGEYCMIPTGVACQIYDAESSNYEIQVRGRSGLASKGIFAHMGTVDFGYTGEIRVVLFNMSGDTRIFTPGERIAQIVVSKIEKPSVEFVEALEETNRGEKGFGSSGK